MRFGLSVLELLTLEQVGLAVVQRSRSSLSASRAAERGPVGRSNVESGPSSTVEPFGLVGSPADELVGSLAAGPLRLLRKSYVWLRSPVLESQCLVQAGLAAVQCYCPLLVPLRIPGPWALRVRSANTRLLTARMGIEFVSPSCYDLQMGRMLRQIAVGRQSFAPVQSDLLPLELHCYCHVVPAGSPLATLHSTTLESRPDLAPLPLAVASKVSVALSVTVRTT